jgi:hypothetical protein
MACGVTLHLKPIMFFLSKSFRKGEQLMPIECEKLRLTPLAMNKCTKCFESSPDFMRGQVQSFWRRILGLKYCAVICRRCREIIGWEKPKNGSLNER